MKNKSSEVIDLMDSSKDFVKKRDLNASRQALSEAQKLTEKIGYENSSIDLEKDDNGIPYNLSDSVPSFLTDYPQLISYFVSGYRERLDQKLGAEYDDKIKESKELYGTDFTPMDAKELESSLENRIVTKKINEIFDITIANDHMFSFDY